MASEQPERSGQPEQPERYDFRSRDSHWSNKWVEDKLFATQKGEKREDNEYVLDMFPYPSGSGLHVGHMAGYLGTDAYSRMRRMQGKNVLHPMGWDAFGLPAEQHAIKTGEHPSNAVEQASSSFRSVMQRIGLSYDWDREINTTDPNYYKWTQWIFTKLYERGLAYMEESVVNWCPELGTVLSNEEVIEGKSERGGFPVERKPLKQWVLKITEYADRLLEDLELVDWPDSVKEMQRNWIGRSEGLQMGFPIDGVKGADGVNNAKIDVYTTRPETLAGVTYVVLAPEHPLVEKIVTAEQREAVNAYATQARNKQDIDRQREDQQKTGVFTGAYVNNPLTGEKVQVWIGDYVLGHYGTGAVMGVPSADQRDKDFAAAYGLSVVDIFPNGVDEDPDSGVLQNSGFLDGMNAKEARAKIMDFAEEQGFGARKVNYKLRDWVFSRQRYWGEPFPIIHQPDGSTSLVDEKDLPLLLPEMSDFNPVKGSNPTPVLSKAGDWVNLPDGGRRETNTMPNWAGSCWYYLRFIDPDNDQKLADPEKLSQWLPVDLYVGGTEHAVLHLLYARFWHKVLFDAGVVPTKEPFQQLRNQGMILGEDGQKMSKSIGNVVPVDTVIDEHGVDVLRAAEMFLGPFEKTKPWSTKGMQGVKGWLDRTWKVFQRVDEGAQIDPAIQGEVQLIIQGVTQDIEQFKFNTAISKLMVLTNMLMKMDKVPRQLGEILCKLMAPIAPMMAEEVWNTILSNEYSVHRSEWPQYDETMASLKVVTLAVQVNGKLRGTLDLDSQVASDEDVVTLQARGLDAVKRAIGDQEIARTIFVPKKVVNFVTKK